MENVQIRKHRKVKNYHCNIYMDDYASGKDSPLLLSTFNFVNRKSLYDYILNFFFYSRSNIKDDSCYRLSLVFNRRFFSGLKFLRHPDIIHYSNKYFEPSPCAASVYILNDGFDHVCYSFVVEKEY